MIPESGTVEQMKAAILEAALPEPGNFYAIHIDGQLSLFTVNRVSRSGHVHVRTGDDSDWAMTFNRWFEFWRNDFIVTANRAWPLYRHCSPQPFLPE